MRRILEVASNLTVVSIVACLALCLAAAAQNSRPIFSKRIPLTQTPSTDPKPQPNFTQPPGFVSFSVPGSTYTVAYGVNNLGEIVGAFVSGGVGFGFLRDASGRFRKISVPGSSFTIAQDINDLDEIVGWYGLPNGPTQGFIEHHGVYTTLSYPGAVTTAVDGINNAGDVVGVYQTPTQHGFIYTHGEFQTIDPPGSVGTLVEKISNTGEIVGAYNLSSTEGSGFTLSNGIFSDINYPGAVGTQVVGVNDQGDLAGGWNNEQAFVYQNTTQRFTGFAVKGSGDCAAEGINNSHEIVGFYVSGGTFYGYYRLPSSSDTDLFEADPIP